MKRIIESIERKALAIELSQVEVPELPAITAADAERVVRYPVSPVRAVEAERREFGDGLLTKLHRQA